MKTYTDKRGYQRFKDSNTPVHRWVAENSLGRKLKKCEVVHHKDRNKSNNSAGNLHVFKSQSEHDKIHRKDARKYGKDFSYKGFKRKSRRSF